MTQKLKVSFTDEFGDLNSLNFAEIRINLEKVIFFPVGGMSSNLMAEI